MKRKNSFFAGARAPARAPLALALVAALGIVPLTASAAVVTVNSLGDAGSTNTCTLRQAIKVMNRGSITGPGNTTDTGCQFLGTFGQYDTIGFDTDEFPADGSGTITLAD